MSAGTSPRRLGLGLLAGAAAGAAGTTALNGVTYLDMAIRGRGTSTAPEDTVTTLADKTHTTIPGDEETRSNRIAGLGPLMGLVTGIGVGAALGLAQAAGWRPGVAASALTTGMAAMVGSDVPMAALGISDPKTWAAKDWLADAVPHLAYGLVTAAVVRAVDTG
ncbi:MAG: hypothetical protein ACR2LX_13710 [Jatrophihabitans sp.]